MKLRALLLAFAIVLHASFAFGQDFRTGHDAYKRGDYAQAMEILRPHAERGHAGAQFLLGAMYAEGRGVSSDSSEAVKWFRLSAERGLVQAEYALGIMYFTGAGGSRDYAKAEKWLLRAAEKGHTRAQYSLGFLLFFGNTMALWLDSSPHEARKNPVRGYAWMSIAAESGLDRAIDVKDRIQPDLTRDEEAKARQLIQELRARIQAATRQ